MSKQTSHWYRLASIGPHFLVSTAIGFYIGKYMLDKWFDTYPVFTVIFSLLGIAAGFVNLFREVTLLEKMDEEQRASEEHDGAEPTTGETTPPKSAADGDKSDRI